MISPKNVGAGTAMADAQWFDPAWLRQERFAAILSDNLIDCKPWDGSKIAT
jgi:hypothetical protein